MPLPLDQIKVPELKLSVVTEVFALSVHVPPLLMVASSPGPGTPLGVQFVAVNQSPDATFQL